MTKTSLSSVIGTRVPPDTKARFAALAVRHELSESGLLAKMVNEVLKTNSAGARDSTADGAASDRITLRLRNGDRRLAAERARAREMKTGSYLAMLVHNHVRRSAALPPKELDQLKVTCAELAALGRQLRMFGMPNTLTMSLASELSEVIALARREVEVAREATAAVVRQNVISWETDGELSHA
ncbi:hypothetical protein SAMN05518854_114144 [Variovorax sp. YR266]|uniref:hypothetical protein n=1 Tax=Variovorax sp. YR266 TaxID=1884386 RepID=UPI00089617ED|nr:hypothetical protein [Variovorax sp. YR266]SDZ70583.1 hypothetical protein SAMN05518854_114144 [Variovorax sp. YR266]